jgi:hypothetical protein
MFLLRVLAVAGQFPDPGLDGSAGGVQALVLLGLPVLALGVLAALYWRTRAEVRRRELEPPLYLLTFITAAAHGESPASPPQADQEDLELDRGRRREVTALRQRGTRLLVALGADVAAIWLATAWYVREVRSLPSELLDGRTFTTVERPPAAAPETLTSDLASNIAPQRDPVPARVDPTPAPPPAPAPPSAPVREVSPPPNRTSPPVQERRPVNERPPAPSTAPSTARQDTTVTPTVIPPDIPATVPETVRAAVPETRRAAPPVPPAPDPVRARADAERALDIAVRHVGRELGARRPVAAAGDGAVMVRFVEWIRSQRTTVTTGVPNDIAVEGSSGEAILPVTLRWRDDFGVGKQRTIRLRIAVQRRADDWVFSGAELLEKFP